MRTTGNLAAHLGLRPVDGAVLPQSVHLLLVGFNGDGHRNVSVTEEELRQWVEHADTVLPHFRAAPPAGVTPHGGPLFAGESYVSWNVSVHATLAPASVTAVLERAVAVLSRPVDPGSAEAATATPGGQAWLPDMWYHVDAAQFGALLASLTTAMGLGGASSTIVLFNPRRDLVPPKYGYRAGFSAQEVRLLRSEWHTHNLESAVVAHSAHGASPLPTLHTLLPPASPAASKQHRSWWSHRMGAERERFTLSKGREWEVRGWIDSATAALDAVAAFNQNQAPSAAVRAAAVAVLARARQAGSGETAASVLGRALRRQLDGSPEGHVAAECVTDTFVSPHGRVAWADLTAGPVSWGPLAHGATAAVRRTALVDSVFGPDPGAANAHGGADADELRNDLEAMVADRYSVRAQGGTGWGSVAFTTTHVHASDTLLPATWQTDDDGIYDDVKTVEVELDIYEAFAHKHCTDKPLPPPLCGELRARVAELEAELEELYQEQEGGEGNRTWAKARPHGWTLLDGDVAAAPRARAARDRFFTELVALLYSHLRHVAVPVVSAGAFRHHDVVRLNVYDVTWGGDSPAARKAPSHVDMSALAAQVQGLLLPGQALQVTSTPLLAGDDAALGAALAAAARSAVTGDGQGSNAANGLGWVAGMTPEAAQATYGASGGVHRYLDPWEMHRQLSVLGPQTGRRGRGGNNSHHAPTSDASDPSSTRTLVIPVFVITALGGPPLYLDPSGSATSLSLGDLVLAVVSPHRAVPAPAGFVCGGPDSGPLRVDHTDATSAVVRAVAGHLGGARPTCDGPDAASEDCTWSTGAHVLSSTASSGSGGTAGGGIADVVGRSYVVTCMDASMDDANGGIEALQRVRTSGGGTESGDDDADAADGAAWRAYTQAGPAVAATLAHWRATVDAWHATADAAGDLDWATAVRSCREAEAASHAFRLAAQALAAHMRPHHCGSRPSPVWALLARLRRVPPGWLALVAAGLGAVGAASWTCFALAKPRRVKPKLN